MLIVEYKYSPPMMHRVTIHLFWSHMPVFEHEVKKPFKCGICEYSFSQKKQINTQAASVHEEKTPFKYDICDHSCSRKSHIGTDVASAHNGKIQLNVKFATTVVLRHVSPVHVGKKV